MGTYHLEGPDPADPNFDFAFNSVDIVQLNALPPTSSRWFPPKQKKLLGHSDIIAG